MNAAKIRLSAQEMELVKNADWILTKNAIMQKGRELLEMLQMQLQAYTEGKLGRLPEGLLKPYPKISRGENYRGLPYLILDYPRYFTKDNICAIRCMFWWGNFFSITLHLSGSFKKNAMPKLEENFDSLRQKQFYLSAKAEWEHHFESDHYVFIKQLEAKQFAEMGMHSSFIKIAKHYPVQLWEEVIGYLEADYRYLLDFCYA